jgi:uncharacterized protein (DUF983 family)
MITKGTKLYSVLHEKCPRCQEGNLFVASPFNPAKFTKMPEFCPHCGLRFEMEPSFFFGSMYVSYAFQVAILVATYLALRLTINPSAWGYVLTAITATFITLPFSFRLSRAIWINFFISYNPRNSKPSIP